MSSHDPSAPAGPPALPLVIQVGFSGARRLYDEKVYPHIDSAAFESQVASQLAALLKEIPGKLKLDSDSFYFCGISQIAIGGDSAFTRACEMAGWSQRIFLPQHRDEYLAAQGSVGPDFTQAQRENALSLLKLPHIIQERLVSDAQVRSHRFQDANLEVVRVSDFVIAMTRSEQEGKVGGAHEFAELAKKRRKPVLKIVVSVASDGTAKVDPEWSGIEHFHPPVLPHALEEEISQPSPGSEFPDAATYAAWLKNRFSPLAGKQSKQFIRAAFIIIGTHIVATLLAVIALKIHSVVVLLFLALEIGLLITGFAIHQRLHATHAVSRWADFRLTAEIARSLRAIDGFHAYLEHLFDLPFPPSFRPLLRTLSYLHLRSAPRNDDNWEAQRDAYVKTRLTDPKVKAQIPYQESTRDDAERYLTLARGFFMFAALSAIGATLTKLVALGIALSFHHEGCESIASLAGVFAILLPVLAVAALSLATALDLEAKKHTSEEMLIFLKEQKALILAASSPREFRRLLIETESRLLGETVAWHPRRSFLGIA